MITFLLRRIGSGLLLVLAISFIAYNLLYLAAGDVARGILGEHATQDQVVLKNQQLGLDQPVITRYFSWLGHAFQGDLGKSYFTTESVSAALANRIPVTLSLLIAVTLISAVLAFAFGVLAAVRRGWFDRVVQLTSVVAYSLPGFLVALFLVTVLALQLHLFPATGYVAPDRSLAGWITTTILPVAALTLHSVAGIAQQVRSATIDVLRQDFVTTLRSRGLPERTIIAKHVLRNSAAPGLTVLALQFVGLLTGAIVVEQIFALPGLGTLAVQYTARGDIPVVMGLILVASAIVVVVNLLVDIAVGLLNPKVRVS